LSPAGELDAIVDNVRTMVHDPELRMRIGTGASRSYEALAASDPGHLPVMELYQRLIAA
jgi:hypothetical protein